MDSPDVTSSRVLIDEVDADSPAAQEAALSYYRELADRLHGGFDPESGGAVRDSALTAPNGLLLLATLDGGTVGCGGLAFQSDGYAEIKRLWTAPSARGMGLGRRIMAELIDRARTADVRTVRLDTNGSLTEAISLYRALGFREVPRYNDNPYAHHWFALDLAATP